jgi:glycosyltransferase involved in cell wall biosynthesis
LIVTRADPIGGAQIHVRDLAVALQAAGHTPTVLTSGSGPLIEDFRKRKIPVVILRHLCAPMQPLRDLRALGEIRAVLTELRPELVAAHSAKAGMLGRLAARSLQVPVVVTVHGWACAPGTPALQAGASRIFERLTSPFATKMITVSEFDRRFGLDLNLVAEHQVVTVHNGIPDVPVSLRADPSRTPPRLVMIARFGPQKDHRTLLRALGGLQEQSWRLDLLGDGPLLREMEALAAALGIADRIRFMGQRMDVDQILAASQGFLLVTNWEGFPLSILEAMRAGLPVIASAVGGVSESVLDGDTGYLIPKGDVERLRKRIAELVSDPALRSRLGARGRQHYEQHFTLESAVSKTLAVYQDVLSRRGTGT